MSNKIYSVTGRVVDRTTGHGMPNLRVEAWDMSGHHQGAVGSSNADENGRFVLCLDLRRSGLERAPDLYFKVYRGTELLVSTEESVVLNSGEDKEVVIELNVKVEHPAGKDRVSARQFYTGVDFIQQSDFMGLFTETKKKARTKMSFITDMIRGTVTNSDIKPVKVGNTKENDVINQPVDNARKNLEDQKIIVNEVLPYNPKIDRASLKDASTLPTRLKPGQKLNLYQQDGKVRHYSIVKDEKTNSEFSEIAKEHKEELIKLKEELNVTKANFDKKDAEMSAITNEYTTKLTRMQEELTVTRESVAKKDLEIESVNKEHRDQLTRIQEELKITRENFTRKDAEMAEVTREHRERFTKMQEELVFTREASTRKDAEITTFNEELKALKNDQSGLMNLLKPENLTKLIKDSQISITDKIIRKKDKKTPDN